MAANVKIAWKDVTVRFGSKTVLDGLNLEAHEGRSLVIIGGSGTGKSVTIKTALGLIKPNSGRVEIDGRKVAYGKEDDPGVAQIGMLFQSGALFDSLPVWKNVAFRLLHAEHMDEDEAREAARGATRRGLLTARRPSVVAAGHARALSLPDSRTNRHVARVSLIMRRMKAKSGSATTPKRFRSACGARGR